VRNEEENGHFQVGVVLVTKDMHHMSFLHETGSGGVDLGREGRVTDAVKGSGAGGHQHKDRARVRVPAGVPTGTLTDDSKSGTRAVGAGGGAAPRNCW
jgi:hypothetical protein